MDAKIREARKTIYEVIGTVMNDEEADVDKLLYVYQRLVELCN